MKSKNEYQFTVVLIFASIALALITMVSLSSIRLGLDFGKDTRIVASIKDEPRFMSFVEELQFNHAQTRLKVTDGDIFILDISGVESGEAFEKQLLAHNPTATIILSGTFGSMTKFFNNQSFVTTCLFVFIVLLGVYYIARYHLAGWYYWVFSSIALLTPLIISSSLGIAFTQTMWYAFFVSFFVVYSLNIVSYERHKKIFTLIPAMLILMGFVMMFFVQFPYFSAGFYIFSFGIVLGLLFYLHGLFIVTMLKDYLEGRVFSLSDLFEVEDSKSVLFSRFISVILIVVLMGGLLALSRGSSLLNSSLKNRDTILIFNKSDSATYLEVQARLSKLDLFDKQINYRVSEQGQTWLEFDESVSLLDLETLANDLTIGLDLSVKYYQTSSEMFLAYNWVYLIFIVVLVSLCMSLVYDTRSLRGAIWYGVVVLMSYGVFVLFSSVFGILDGYSWLFMLLILPLMVLLVILRFITEDTIYYRRFFVEVMISSISSLLLMSLPVLIIFPIPKNSEMMLVFLIMFLAVHTALGIIGKKEKKNA